MCKNFKKILCIPETRKTIPTSETEKKFYSAVYNGNLESSTSKMGQTFCTAEVASNALLYALESIIKDKNPVELTCALEIIQRLATFKDARVQKCNYSIQKRDIYQEISLVVQKFELNIETAIFEKNKEKARTSINYANMLTKALEQINSPIVVNYVKLVQCAYKNDMPLAAGEIINTVPRLKNDPTIVALCNYHMRPENRVYLTSPDRYVNNIGETIVSQIKAANLLPGSVLLIGPGIYQDKVSNQEYSPEFISIYDAIKHHYSHPIQLTVIDNDKRAINVLKEDPTRQSANNLQVSLMLADGLDYCMTQDPNPILIANKSLMYSLLDLKTGFLLEDFFKKTFLFTNQKALMFTDRDTAELLFNTPLNNQHTLRSGGGSFRLYVEKLNYSEMSNSDFFKIEIHQLGPADRV